MLNIIKWFFIRFYYRFLTKKQTFLLLFQTPVFESGDVLHSTFGEILILGNDRVVILK